MFRKIARKLKAAISGGNGSDGSSPPPQKRSSKQPQSDSKASSHSTVGRRDGHQRDEGGPSDGGDDTIEGAQRRRVDPVNDKRLRTDEDTKKLLDFLFNAIIHKFLQINAFSSNAPSFFVVYAHDNITDTGDGLKAGASQVQQLMHWLEFIHSNIKSDRSPLYRDWKRETEGIHGAHDILANQICLLPQSKKTGKCKDYVGSVNKVVLFGSELLEDYVAKSKQGKMKEYAEKLEALFLAMSEEWLDGNNEDVDRIKTKIWKIAGKYVDEPGFHHVLTELIFLKIRFKPNFNQEIIPIVLSGNGMKSLPIVENEDKKFLIWMAPPEPDNSDWIFHETQVLQRLFFKLLLRLFDNRHTIIKGFQDCYNICAKTLFQSLDNLPSEEDFRKTVETQFAETVIKITEQGIADVQSINNEKDRLKEVDGSELKLRGLTSYSHSGSGDQLNVTGNVTKYSNSNHFQAGTGPLTIHTGSGPLYNGPVHYHRGEKSKEKRQQDCWDALHLLTNDPAKDRHSIITTRGRHVDGTCQWIRDVDEFRSWLNDSAPLLWISGGPGKGKTFLSIYLVDYLSSISPRNALVLNFFCDNSDNKRNSACAVLGGFLYQLLEADKSLYDYILPHFELRQKENANLFVDQHLEELWTIFENMLRRTIIDQKYLLLDGLDECNRTEIEFLRTKFEAFYSKPNAQSSIIKTIIVSRSLPNAIQKAIRIDLDEKHKQERDTDLKAFITTQVRNQFSSRSPEDKVSSKLEATLLEKAEGLFLWVGLAMNILKDISKKEVAKLLANGSINKWLPKGLDDIYNRMLVKIPNDEREVAAKIFQWVSIAFRPLTLTELCTLIDIDPVPDMTTEDSIRETIDCCRDLLLITEKETLQFVHLSFKEHLKAIQDPAKSNQQGEFKESQKILTFGIHEEKAHTDVYTRCLQNMSTYLKRDICSLKEPSVLLDELSDLDKGPLVQVRTTLMQARIYTL
ncbi:hypothetical protein BP6252_00451 [Coleophoma cylindrospora]|uniref:NACHT domain-containing protein n=1 Tax=Coleophoma cylindrospora TaxID=1849047 RepID=A0A3D8SQ18_9HELO|nr:hypothetical protein BP6252_00451 [Coleophoma cylindrospora]